MEDGKSDKKKNSEVFIFFFSHLIFLNENILWEELGDKQENYINI